ncbi:MAG TPA: ABC transporter ATP-binding protein [Candidatus Krumholzibacterium sp.]|nr:ABC transporter ATP-binding protein [Candidatus Krumholzibacterium sp.]
MKREAIIRILGLKKQFAGQSVLAGVDLDIERGETLVVMGRSGCGKSVLLKHITGLIKPDEGGIFFEGEDITQFSRKKLFQMRMHFGMLFQSAALFDSMTVGENVGLPLRKHTGKDDDEVREIVSEKLRLVGLEGIQDRYPAELSGGMKKRVGLARAVVMEPQVVLYDEPTTGLDPIMADVINNLIRDLQRELDITSVVVTHDIGSAYKVADHLAMLYEGKIIHEGTPEEIRGTGDEIVRQFIEGRAEGPISVV